MSETGAPTADGKLARLAGLPLFSFGTLMDDGVLELVSGQSRSDLHVEPVVLVDHVQREVIGESFPVLLPQPGGRAPGTLIFGLNQTAMQRILFFEGEEYALDALEVELDGRPVAACHFRDANTYRTGDRTWDLGTWQQSSRAEFLPRARRYMALYGTMSKREADAHW